jgi:hypothetical protein
MVNGYEWQIMKNVASQRATTVNKLGNVEMAQHFWSVSQNFTVELSGREFPTRSLRSVETLVDLHV